jgi:drug/metabolite transporter (DMT)-like permease
VSRPDRTTLIAFIFFVILGGSNAVAVRISNFELPPFWGASMRFAAAAVIFWLVVLALRMEVPRGRSLSGAGVYGLLTVGGAYGFLYWGLLEVPASVTMVVMAFGPLITFFLAILHRVEKFRWRGLVGALVALVGIFLGVSGGAAADVPFVSLLAIVAGTACLAEGTVLFKFIPKGHPVMTNAIALTTGAAMLVGISLIAGETWILPTTTDTWLAYGYLVFFGSVGVFYLALFILSRWTASATSYAFLMFPISTVIIAAWLLDEPITISFLFGAVLVALGVWIGALSNPKGAEAEQSLPSAERAVS